MNNIRYVKLVPEAVESTRAHHNDAGFDMVAVSKKITNDYVQYGTGIALEIPDGMVGLIYPRSSVTKKDLMLKNSVGVIDAGYRGEILFRFDITNRKYNHNDDGTISLVSNIYEIGDKIGQINFQILPDVTLHITHELEGSERGEGKFGSTDKK